VKRVYAPPEAADGAILRFPAKIAHYIKNVLRAKEGDVLIVFDGNCEHVTRLKSASRGRLEGEITHTRVTDAHASPNLTVAFGSVRPGPVTEILRHGSELGVTRFVLLHTERTVRNAQHAKDRWREIVVSAAAQCGRSDIPEVTGPVRFEDFLIGEARESARILLQNAQDALPLSLVADSTDNCAQRVLCVGPEGGFTDGEIDRAQRAGFLLASLGPRTLRSETAAITGVGILAARFWAMNWRGAVCLGPAPQSAE
jgi:16S rRNA (uracil1498-N3)-methyltransferase